MSRNTLTATAVFSILMGLALMGTWGVMFALGQVPELATTPWETSLLLVAEFLTGLSLVASGIGILTRQRWSATLGLASLGMLTYCTINFSGILAQQNNVPAALFMAAVAVISIVLIVLLVRQAAARPGQPIS